MTISLYKSVFSPVYKINTSTIQYIAVHLPLLQIFHNKKLFFKNDLSAFI